MGVTNGFLRLTREEFALLEKDENAFQQRCMQRDDDDYLDMDKAGVELIIIFDPAMASLGEVDIDPPYPAISDVLMGGPKIHEHIDLGYGPAQRVEDDVLQKSLNEFDAVDFDQCFQLACDESVEAFLMAEMDEETFRGYYWDYLQSLGQFVKESVDRDMVVLRY